jgi:hypothetical protein
VLCGAARGERAIITLVILPLVLAFGPLAVWALKMGGLRRLWMLCALALLTVLFLALLLSAVYSVPSPWRVVLYFLVFVGPSILLATGFLALSSSFARTLPLQLIAVFAGSMIGLGVGFVVVVYALGVR